MTDKASMRTLAASCSLTLLLFAACGGSSAPARDGGAADAGASADGGTQGESASVAGVVSAHNAARAAVSPAASPALAPLVWSPDAASTASAWAAGCVYMHNPDNNIYGENIYASTADPAAAAVVGDWASEKSNYDYANNACTGVCGHYTQVVWRSTTSVGCAKQRCTSGSPFGSTGGGVWYYFVCNYFPPGNVGGERPY